MKLENTFGNTENMTKLSNGLKLHHRGTNQKIVSCGLKLPHHRGTRSQQFWSQSDTLQRHKTTTVVVLNCINIEVQDHNIYGLKLHQHWGAGPKNSGLKIVVFSKWSMMNIGAQTASYKKIYSTYSPAV